MTGPVSNSALTRPLVRLADSVFARLSPYPGNALLNHCLRQYEFARQLTVTHAVAFDWDTLYAIALLRPLGVFDPLAQPLDAQQRSVRLFEREFHHQAMPEKWELVRECLRLDVRSICTAKATPAVELFRQAIWIESTLGHRRYRLSKVAVREVFEAYPRDDLNAVLLDFFRRTIRPARFR